MTRICAHAGFDGTIPNSLESLELASGRGCDVVELDVNLYEDALVLAHDAGAFENRRPHLFAQGLSLLKNRGIMVNCDIKEPSAAQEAAALIKEFGMGDSAFFTGELCPDFEHTGAYKFFLNSDNPRLDIPSRIGPAEGEKLAAFFRESKNDNFLGYNFDYRALDPEGLDLLLDADIPFILWTVDDEELIPAYLVMNVWGLTTNKIRFALECRKSVMGG
jgi:glycerophosphoryl diester phosphodiesterase